jgi:hypothetical protein
MLLAAALLLPTAATADPINYQLGVNQVGLGWMPANERNAILSDMAANGVHLIRIPLHPPFSAVLDAIDVANHQGIKVILVVSLNIKDFYEPTVVPRSGQNRVETSYPLSQIRPEMVRQALGNIMAAMEQRRISLYAIQVGNEINWTFNGDMQVYSSRGTGRVYRELADLPNATAFLRGADKYIEILRIVRDLRNASQINRQAILLPAGMARIRPDFAASIGADALDAGAAIGLLKARGLDLYVEGHAMHYYPSYSGSASERIEGLSGALKDCKAGSSGKACWITEWGLNNTSTVCPPEDGGRASIVREMRQALDKAARGGELAAAVYFEWKGRSPRSIWRCDGLTEGGREALRSPPN